MFLLNHWGSHRQNDCHHVSYHHSRRHTEGIRVGSFTNPHWVRGHFAKVVELRHTCVNIHCKGSGTDSAWIYTGAHFTNGICITNSMETSFCSHPNPNILITMNFCTCHDSCSEKKITSVQIFQWIWIANKTINSKMGPWSYSPKYKQADTDEKKYGIKLYIKKWKYFY